MNGAKDQNFASQVIVDTRAIRPPGFYKSIILDILTISSALLFSFAYSLYTAGESNLWLLLGSLTAFAILGTLETFLITSLPRRAVIILLETIALLAFLYDRPSGALFLVGGLMLFFQVLGEIDCRRLLSNSLELRFFKMSRLKLVKTITAITIMVVVLYLPQLTPESLSVKNVFLNPKIFQSFFDWASGMVNKLYPEIDLNSSIEKLARDIAVFRLNNISDFKNLTPKEQENSIAQATKDIIVSLSENLQITISGDKPANELFYNIIVLNLERWKNSFGNWFLIGWIAIFFLIVRGFGFVFSVFAAVIAFIVIEFLLGVNFIHIAGESRMKETLKF